MSHLFISLPCMPPNRSELEINAHQLGLMRDLHIPEPAVLLTLANQLDNLRAAPPEPKEVNPESREGDGTKDETPKKVKPVETGDIPRKHHRSHEEKCYVCQLPRFVLCLGQFFVLYVQLILYRNKTELMFLCI